nr:P3 protein [Brugmansia suaveolens mottle virus]
GSSSDGEYTPIPTEEVKVTVPLEPRLCGINEHQAVTLLLKGIYKRNVMKELLMDEPYIMLFSILSPSVLVAMYDNRAFEQAINIWINKDQSIALIATILSNLAEKVSLAETLTRQTLLIENSAEQLMDATFRGFQLSLAYNASVDLITNLREKARSNCELTKGGYTDASNDFAESMEKNYQSLLQTHWNELSWRERLSAYWFSRKQKRQLTKLLRKERTANLRGVFEYSPKPHIIQLAHLTKQKMDGAVRVTKGYIDNKCVHMKSYMFSTLLNRLPNAKIIISSVFIIGALLNMAGTMNFFITEHENNKAAVARMALWDQENACHELYTALERKLGQRPSWDEYCEYVNKTNPSLREFIEKNYNCDNVAHQ